MAFLLGRIHIIMPAGGLMTPGSTADCQSRQNTLVPNYTAQNSWRGLDSFGDAAMDLTTDKGQPFARATPSAPVLRRLPAVSSTSPQFNRPGVPQFFVFIRAYWILRMLRWSAATGRRATRVSPMLGRLPTALSTRIPAQASPGVRRERRFPPSLKPSGAFLSVSQNDTLAVLWRHD